MPKMNKTNAKAASDAADEGGSFEPMLDGRYICKLVECEAKEGKTAPYWSWQYEVNEEGEFLGRKLWDNTSLSEKALWRVGQVFAAFEVPADTDTDELIGREVAIIVGHETAQAGKRQGQLVNVVVRLEPLTDEEKDYQADTAEAPEI